MSGLYDIFLSHSGKQKEYVEKLHTELKQYGRYSVFFDKDSIKHGEEISATVMEHAKTCKLAVAVLSEEYFTRSKPPMMELAASYPAGVSGNGGPHLLPVFFALKPEHVKEIIGTKDSRWLKKWGDWQVNEIMSDRISPQERISRVPPVEWKIAVDKLLDTCGPICKPRENEKEPDIFVKKVAQVIAETLDKHLSGRMHQSKVEDNLKYQTEGGSLQHSSLSGKRSKQSLRRSVPQNQVVESSSQILQQYQEDQSLTAHNSLQYRGRKFATEFAFMPESDEFDTKSLATRPGGRKFGAKYATIQAASTTNPIWISGSGIRTIRQLWRKSVGTTTVQRHSNQYSSPSSSSPLRSNFKVMLMIIV